MRRKGKEKAIKHGRGTNFILAQDVSITFNTNAYNKLGLQDNGLGWIHNLVIGATGTGKSRYFVRPNVYSLPTDPITGRAISMVITDPKGDLLKDTGAFLEAHGYVIKVFNLFERDKSDCYNPFAYIRSEQDIAVLVSGIVANMGEGKNEGDHWEANARYVLQGICSYIYYEMPYTEANFGTVLKLLNMWESSENDDNFQSDYDYLIEDLRKRKGNDHPAVTWRDKVSAKGAELSSIISTAQTITGVFNQSSIRTITETDSLELDKVGDRPTALFVITPPTTKVYNFLAALMYTQLFTMLQNKANLDYKDQGQTLPHKVWFILDEFANIGKIPDFDVQITLIRSAGMFCSIIVQAPSQITAIYDKIAPTILSNCSFTLFLGSSGNSADDMSAADYIAKNIGKMTIQAEGTSVDYNQLDGPKRNYNYGAIERNIMTVDEVKRMPGDMCIILMGGSLPIMAKKIQDLESCMNYDLYEQIGDYDVAKKKDTKLTYVEGRNKSQEIEKIQDACRAEEDKQKHIFLKINEDYERSLEEQEEEFRQVYEDAVNLAVKEGDDIADVVTGEQGFNPPAVIPNLNKETVKEDITDPEITEESKEPAETKELEHPDTKAADTNEDEETVTDKNEDNSENDEPSGSDEDEDSEDDDPGIYDDIIEDED